MIPPKYRLEIYKVRAMVSRAVKKGIITKPSHCEICNCNHRRIEAHHLNYNRPLDIEWLCSSCHKGLHGVIDSFKNIP